MKKLFASISVLIALVAFAAPSLTLAQATGRGDVDSCRDLQGGGVESLVECIVGFFDYFVYLLVALSVVLIVIGAFKMIYSEEKREEGKDTIVYGIIALFVMMSIWGLVNILHRTFNLNTDADSTTQVQLIP